MSNTQPTQDLGELGETTGADDQLSSVRRAEDQINAVAIDFQYGRCGFAVFVEEEHQLLLCEDLLCDFAFNGDELLTSAHNVDTDGDAGEDDRHGDQTGSAATGRVRAFGHAWHGLIESLLSQFNPDLILVSSRCPEAFLALLRNSAEQRSGTVEVRQARDFQVALGLSSIEEATIFSRAAEGTRDATPFAAIEEGMMSTMVTLDAKVATSRSALSISATAPLLSSLRSRRDIGRSLTVVSLCLDDYLFVDENTLKSLNICSGDVHGFVHAKGGREGFSVLGMLPERYEEIEREAMRGSTTSAINHPSVWIFYSYAEFDLLQVHEAVELLVRQEAVSEVVQIRSRLSELGGVPHLCFYLNMGTGSVFTWERLLKTCNAVIRIRQSLNALDLRMSDMIREIKEQISTEPILRLSDTIEHIIDFNESKAEGKISVKAGVDTHLDELRERHAGIPAMLDRVAAEVMKEPAFRSTTRAYVVYFPQIGYLIQVPNGEMVDMLADPSLEQAFASPDDIYLKNSRMKTMDQHLGDIASFIVDKEIEVLDGLHALLNKCSPALLKAHAALTQLDCLMAFARAATLYDLRRPNLLEEQVIRLKGSRHALKALADDSFVPNDIDLRAGVGLSDQDASYGPDWIADEPQDPAGRRKEADKEQSTEEEHEASHTTNRTEDRFSVMVLTGANSSGKSCLLQQVALAVFLSQCGSFVPAAHAELGVFDKILTRMRQDESVASEGSSFTRELGRLHRAIALSTKRSLVILDEVGRECRSDDGAGLFIATIFDYLQRGQDCPIVLSATHHLRAIEKHLPPTLPIQRAHMQTIFLPLLADSSSSLTYLYRLKPGFAGTSHACHCARFCGVPESVVERADRICRVGLRVWHDAEAMRDEAIVRRLLQLELGNNDGEEEEIIRQQVMQTDDTKAKELINWVLEGDDQPPSSSG